MALNLTNKQLIPNNTDKAVIFISLPCLYIPILFALAFAQLLAVSLLLFRFLIYTLFPYLLCKPSAPVSRASARDKGTNHRLSAQKQRKTPFIQKKARKHLAVSRKVRTFALAFKNRALGHEVLSENPKLF